MEYRVPRQLLFAALFAALATSTTATLYDGGRRTLTSSEVISDITSLTAGTCKSGAIVVECGMMGPTPCDNATCASYPGAPCAFVHCKSRYRGKVLPACTPIFYDRETQNVLDCKDRVITVITKCAKRSLQALCTRDTYNACVNATCPANPNATCIVKTCDAIYRGQYLSPCEPIWYDKKTGNVLNATEDCSCTKCKDLRFTPVCGADNMTYPNSCAALCAGTTVKKTGRCSKCSGTTAYCKKGVFGDACVVDSESLQCNPDLLCLGSDESGTGFALGHCSRI